MKLIKKYLNNKFRILALIGAVIAVPLFSGCGSSTTSGYKVNLEIWGTNDDSTVYAAIIDQYKKINPYVGEIKYRKFSQDTYKQELLDALASGQAPDIFLINNAWLPSFENKIDPAATTLASEQDLKNNFPDSVSTDFMDGGKVYAVPLSMDSMEMYYNKDMFNAAGIASPPKNWQEFQDDIKILTKIDTAGNIIRSGAAIGTALNINRSADLLGTLMMQNGVSMPMQKGNTAKFDEGVMGSDGKVFQAGEQAVGFYTQFAKLSISANAMNPLYTWNSRKNNSLDEFAAGSVGMIFNYSWQNAQIKNRNPKLNFAVAPIPQAFPDKPVTTANYWGYAVSLNKVIPAAATSSDQKAPAPVSNDVRMHEAWQFLRFLTLKNSGSITLYNAITKNSKTFPVNFDPAADYLKRTGNPAARRDLIDTQKTDPVLGPFVSGNLIAKHWYQKDPDAVEKIFSDMIESVNSGGVSLHEALILAKNRVNQL